MSLGGRADIVEQPCRPEVAGASEKLPHCFGVVGGWPIDVSTIMVAKESIWRPLTPVQLRNRRRTLPTQGMQVTYCVLALTLGPS